MHLCLIIEGAPIIRAVLRAILADFGFDVIEADTGRNGLALFDRHQPQFVIVDARLKDIPTFDVLRHMRDAAGRRAHVLYCTLQFDILKLQQAHAAGASDVLVKPFDRSSLAVKIDAWRLAQEDADDVGAGRSARPSRAALRRATPC